MKKDFDIIVIGGGINGQVMSLAAAHAGFSVALIDQNKFVEDSLREFDGRAYAIAFSSVQMMKNLDFWNFFHVSFFTLQYKNATRTQPADTLQFRKKNMTVLNFQMPIVEQFRPILNV